MASKFVWADNGNLRAPNVRVQIINLQTHVKEKLLPVDTSMFDPAWAPDSTQIAFSWRGRAVGGTMDIHVVNRNGNGLRKIIEAEDSMAAFNPTWSPDGNELIYNKGLVASETSSKSLWTVVSQNNSHTGAEITSTRIGSTRRLLCRSRLSRPS